LKVAVFRQHSNRLLHYWAGGFTLGANN